MEDTSSVGIQVGGISGGIGNTAQVHSLDILPLPFSCMRRIMMMKGIP